MNLMDIRRHIPLNEETVNQLSKWSSGITETVAMKKLAFNEAVINLDTSIADDKQCSIYFNDKDIEKLRIELYINNEFHTQWYINKNLPMSMKGVSYYHVPNELQVQMTSIVMHTLTYIALYNQDVNLVGGRIEGQNEIIYLNIPSKLPTLPNGIRKETPSNPTVFTHHVDLNTAEPLEKQIQSHLNSFYKGWINQSIPALKGKTPIEAAKTPEGRKELYILFDYIQKQNSPVPFPLFEIKKALGLM